MDIKYIWTEKFRVLEELDLNFSHSGKHRFAYQEDTLQLLANTEPVLKFGSKIDSVTVIAGPNGSGKSSICELLLEIAATAANGTMSYSLRFKGLLCIGDFIFHHKSLPLKNNIELEGHGYTVITFDESPLINLEWMNRTKFWELGFIYFSNMLDSRGDMDLVNLENYATTALIYEDSRYGIRVNRERYGERQTPDFIGAYQEQEGYRQTRFYVNFPGKLPFAPPDTFVLRATYSNQNRGLRYKDDPFEYNDYGKFSDLERDLFYPLYPGGADIQAGQEVRIVQGIALQVAFRLYRFNILMALAVIDRKFLPYQEVSAFVYEGQPWPELFERYPLLQQLLDAWERLMAFGHFRETWFPYDSRGNNVIDWRFDAIEWFYIPNTDDCRLLLRSFMDTEYELLNRKGGGYGNRLYHYYIQPYNSSGEHNYLALFSRLYDAIQRYIQDEDSPRKKIILVLDEADVAYHPVWKKKLLKWVLEFLEQDFNPFQYQLIFTTHSPYLLSDLSADHLLLLNNLEGKTVVVPTIDRLTFGANITDLLADSFFMSDGLIGDFAKQQIQGVIDDLNQWRKTKENNGAIEVNVRRREQCLKLISLIGDLIVRNKLYEMYWEIFEDKAALDSEIDLLNDRITYLKSLKR